MPGMNLRDLSTRTFQLMGLAYGEGMTVAEVDAEVKFVYDEISNKFPWKFLEKDWTFSTVISQEDYYLPWDVKTIQTIRQKTSPSEIFPVPVGTFDYFVPSSTESGTATPTNYVLHEIDMTRLPASSTDTAAAGTDTNTVVGTSASFSATDDTYNGWELVNTTRKASARISDYTGATKTFELETVIASQVNTDTFYIVRNLKKISLYPIPNAAITIYVRGLRHLLPLVNDYDYPDWGPDGEPYHEVLARFAAGNLKDLNDPAKAVYILQKAASKLDDMRRSLERRNQDVVEGLLSMSSYSAVGPSRLPAWYPRFMG